jgi:hypothetical protein
MLPYETWFLLSGTRCQGFKELRIQVKENYFTLDPLTPFSLIYQMRKMKTSGIALAIALFAGIFLFFTHPISHGDFWWHVSTGKWILEHNALPKEDPFAYSTTPGLDPLKKLLLQGYWLAQVIFYLLQKHTGFQGIIVFKAILFSAIFYSLFRILLRKGVDNLLAVPMVALLAILSRPYDDPRPQLFSFLGTLLIFHIMEKGLTGLRREEKPKHATLLGAPLVMLLWANLHPAFIIGQSVIGVFLLAETFKYAVKKNALQDRPFMIFVLWTVTSLLIALINPCKATAAVAIWDFKARILSATINEYLNPWEYARYRGNFTMLYGLAALAVVTASAMVLSWRRLELSHVLLYAGFAGASAAFFRFGIFFILMSAAISAGCIADTVGKTLKRLRPATVILSLAAVALLLALSMLETSIRHGSLRSDYLPEKAADFISGHGLKAPLFNPYEWGGYLIFSLHPGHKVFVDGRNLDYSVTMDYMSARMGRKDSVFEKYRINTVLFYPITPASYRMPGLVFSLLKDPEWRLVYIDEKSVIFVRADTMGNIPSLSKEILWDSLIRTAKLWLEKPPAPIERVNPNMMLGQIYRAMGEEEKALEFYRRAGINNSE